VSADISLQVDLVTMGARLLVEAKMLLFNVPPAVGFVGELLVTNCADEASGGGEH